MINWEAQHKAISTRNTADTPIEKLVGRDLNFWAEFHKKSGGKLKDLTDCLIFDARSGIKMTWEEENFVRLGYDMLINAIKECCNQKELEEKRSKMKVDSVSKKVKLRAKY